MTNVNGKDAADVVAKQAARSGKSPGYSTTEDWKSAVDKAILEAHGKNEPAPPATGAERPIVASYPAQTQAWTAVQSHGWKATNKDSDDGTVTTRSSAPGGRVRDAHQPQQRDQAQAPQGSRLPG